MCTFPGASQQKTRRESEHICARRIASTKPGNQVRCIEGSNEAALKVPIALSEMCDFQLEFQIECSVGAPLKGKRTEEFQRALDVYSMSNLKVA
jgi:hypothetical protein